MAIIKSFNCILFLIIGLNNLMAQPANDLCANAITIGCGQTQSGSTSTATTDVGTPNCGGPLDISGPGVWYKFVGTGDAITASLCNGTNYDSKIIVFSGSCGSLNCVTGNDDACGVQSMAIFNTNVGTNYYILVLGYGGSVGDFTLEITCAPPCLPVPANDNCNTAQAITVSPDIISCSPVNGFTACAAISSQNPGCFPWGLMNDVWYSFNSGTNISVIISLNLGTGTNTFMYALYTNCSSGSVLCGNLSPGSNLITGLTQGTNYKLQIFNNNIAGAGTFTMCLVDGPPVPGNDDCGGSPTTLVNDTPVTFNGTTLGATASAVETNYFNDAVVWEAITLTEPCSDLTVDYCGTTSGVMSNGMIVYTDCPVLSINAGTFDFTTCSDGNLTIQFSSVPAGTYFLPVMAGGGNTPGPYVMNVVSTVCAAAGIEQITDISDKIILFPNPVESVLTISTKRTGIKEMRITDAQGKIILVTEFTETINVADLNEGVYFLILEGDDFILNERFVKSR